MPISQEPIRWQTVRPEGVTGASQPSVTGRRARAMSEMSRSDRAPPASCLNAGRSGMADDERPGSVAGGLAHS